MFAVLRVTAGPDQGYTLTVVEGQTLVIGRGQASGSQLRDPHVARVHCQIQMQGGKALLSDSGSASGTSVNGNKITQQELQPGDLIQIGHTQLSFKWSDADEQSTQSVQENE